MNIELEILRDRLKAKSLILGIENRLVLLAELTIAQKTQALKDADPNRTEENELLTHIYLKLNERVNALAASGMDWHSIMDTLNEEEWSKKIARFDKQEASNV